MGINSWAVATVRYSAAILDWTQDEINDMDRKTRKLLKIYGAFHVKSNVNRLYMKRKEGGRGLISIRDCVDAEIRNLNAYIANSDEELFQFASASLNHRREREFPKTTLHSKKNRIKVHEIARPI